MTVGAPRLPGKNQPSRDVPSATGNDRALGWPIITVKSNVAGERAGRNIWYSRNPAIMVIATKAKRTMASRLERSLASRVVG